MNGWLQILIVSTVGWACSQQLVIKSAIGRICCSDRFFELNYNQQTPRTMPTSVKPSSAESLHDQDIAIEATGVWKIFGHSPAKALDAIKKDGLSKAEVLEKYDAVIGVSDASFEVRRGEIFCIMGLSGSGKSTLVRHINRLLTPTAGKILVDGVDVLSLDDPGLRELRNKKISMVFQNFGLMPHRSVLDNVSMGLEIRGVSQNARWEAADKALSMVELIDWRDKFAHELSGGMQQRVGLARAIATDPDILLMDEPFSALDPLIRRQLQGEFMKLAGIMKKTTVFITHDLDEAVRIGDRIAIMRDGAIVQTGTAEEIIMNPADDYVSDFVAGISRLNLVKAHSLIQPEASYVAQYGALSDDTPVVHESTPLKELIISAVKFDGPLRIEGSDRQTIGVVTKTDLLNAVVAGAEGE